MEIGLAILLARIIVKVVITTAIELPPSIL
jgi:hypothetical protein